MPTIEEMLSQMMNNMPNDEDRGGKPRDTQMWQTTVYQGREMILEHKQNDYGKVLRFTVTALVELMNKNIHDFRIVMCNKQGHIYFSAIGPTTQIIDLKKKETIIPEKDDWA